MRQAALNSVYELAKQDPRVYFVGSDLGVGTLKQFKAEMPERFLMEGVSEANIVGLCAGLALEGKIPYFNTIATFIARRAFEQVAIDLCLHRVPVRLLASGGGLVYAPLGPTHLAIEDLSVLRAIPNLTIVAPSDAEEMKRLMVQSLDYPGPMYIRFGKGGDPVVSSPSDGFRIGKAIQKREGSDALVITTGVTLKNGLDAAAALSDLGMSVGVLHLHTIKPLDEDVILAVCRKVRAIVTIEENAIIGGLGSAVGTLIAEADFSTPKKFKRIGIPDVFPKHYGSQASLMNEFGISTENLVTTIKGLLEKA